jgi:hypothetical protein
VKPKPPESKVPALARGVLKKAQSEGTDPNEGLIQLIENLDDVLPRDIKKKFKTTRKRVWARHFRKSRAKGASGGASGGGGGDPIPF